MDLTLELEQQPILFRVLCDKQVSHTFDLLTLALPVYSEALAIYRELGDRAQEALLLFEIGRTNKSAPRKFVSLSNAFPRYVLLTFAWLKLYPLKSALPRSGVV